MEDFLLLGLLLIFALCIGTYFKKKSGSIKNRYSPNPLSIKFDLNFGDKATILQFSTVICSQCRIAKSIISNEVKSFPDINFIEIDSESNLELVRELKVYSTPTVIILNRDRCEIARVIGVPRTFQLEKFLKSLVF
jgi:hypothetical protein